MPRRTRVEIEAANKKKLAARKARLLRVHHMTLEQYQDLLYFQGGHCYLCRWATGKSKALAVDHDHKRAALECSHDPHDESCINCWRGLLCSVCNKVFRHSKDDPNFFMRGYDYLTNPPAAKFFRSK